MRKKLDKFGRGQQERMMAPRDPDIINLALASVSFSMVRHPFERIVSAYKDKVISNAQMDDRILLGGLGDPQTADQFWGGRPRFL